MQAMIWRFRERGGGRQRRQMLGGGVCEREVLPEEDLITAARADVVLTEGLLLLPGVGGIGADFWR